MSTIDAMLEAILSATRDGRLVWTQSCPQEYLGKGPVEVIIREVAPLVDDDPETVGTQAFELTVNSWINYFWSGTTGGDLIVEILAAGFPQWAHHKATGTKHMNEIIKKLL